MSIEALILKEKETLTAAIKKYAAKFIDLRFTNLRGKEQHISLAVASLPDDFIEHGILIAASSLTYWQNPQPATYALLPDVNSILLDPFYQNNSLLVRCNLFDPQTKLAYYLDPRTVAHRAEKYLRNTGIADYACFGAQPEFFLFDDVRWENAINGAFYKIDADEAPWNSSKTVHGGNSGHRPAMQTGKLPLPPIDALHDLRSAIALTLESLGSPVKTHYQGTTTNQAVITTNFTNLSQKADELQLLKYVVHNVAHNYGKTATFMPKPLATGNGNNMYCQFSLMQNGQNLFAGVENERLSPIVLHSIGGIIAHARTLNAFTNPTANSYKRLITLFNNPKQLTGTTETQPAAISVISDLNSFNQYIELRFADPTTNPYLAFAAILLAAIDGIKRKINPAPLITAHPVQVTPTLSTSFDEAIKQLQIDHEFLLQGEVFSRELINNYIDCCRSEIAQLNSLIHPKEFELYYSL